MTLGSWAGCACAGAAGATEIAASFKPPLTAADTAVVGDSLYGCRRARAVMATALLLGAGCMWTQEVPGPTVGVSYQPLTSLVQIDANVAGGVSVTGTFANTPTPGNVIIAVVSNPGAYTGTTISSGFITALNELNNTPGIATYYKVAGASESKNVVAGGYNFLTGDHQIQIYEISGVEAANAPTIASASGSSLGVFTFASVPAASDGTLILAAGTSLGLSLLPSFSGWTNGLGELFDVNGLLTLNTFTSAAGVASSAGTYNTAVTANALLSAMRGHTISFNRRPTPPTELAVTAKTTQNQLIFNPPSAPLSHVLILVKTADCNFVTNPTGTEAKNTAVGTGVVVLFNDATTSNLGATSISIGGTTSVSYDATTRIVTHSGLTAGTIYCYKVFARNVLALDDASGAGRLTRTGTPTAGGMTDPSFVYNTGSTSLSAPTVVPNVGSYYADNAGKVVALNPSGARLFSPYTMPDAVQNRSTVGTLTGDSNPTLFMSSTSGDAYAIWAAGGSAGSLRWSTEAIDGDSGTGGDQVLGPLYAGPLVSDTLSRVFLATRNTSGLQNRLFALNASSGACVWVFNGSCAGATSALNVGQISAIPILNPTTSRLFFTSTSLSSGSTLWALDATDGASSRVVWSRNLGDSDSAVSFTSVARSGIVFGTNSGRVYHLDPSNGNTCWGSAADGCGGLASGSEQAYCTSSNTRSTSCSAGSAIKKGIAALNGAGWGKWLFSTADGNVRLISSAGVLQWQTSVAGASAPLALPDVSTGVIYVGGSDGKVHQLNLSNGTDAKQRSCGSASAVVGDPAYDSTAGLLYVNTTEGKHYAFSVPF